MFRKCFGGYFGELFLWFMKILVGIYGGLIRRLLVYEVFLLCVIKCGLEFFRRDL